MSEKQVTVKSMMLDFATRLRKEGTESVSLEFFERLANKEVAALEARLSKMEELESEVDMLRTVIEDTDKAELLEALEQSTKEALTLRERVEELETEGCGQCEACEDFFPLSLLNITDDGVALCSGDWDEVLEATAALAADDDLDKLTTQQKPTEEAMEETRSSADL